MDSPRKKVYKRKIQKRLKDDIEEVGSSQWMRVVQYRMVWRELWRPAAGSGMRGRDDYDHDDDDNGSMDR